MTGSGYDPNLGLFVSITHGPEIKSVYGHLSQIRVVTGDFVASGDPIGITGSSGKTTGEHLHFSVRLNGRYVNPLRLLFYVLIKSGRSN